MKGFNLTLPGEEKSTKENTDKTNYNNEYEDETQKLKSINDLDTEPEKISVKTESDMFMETSNSRKPVLWGGDKDKVMNCGGGDPRAQVPPFFVKKGKNGIIYIHVYWNHRNIPAEGQIYQLLGSLTEEDVVHIHLHEIPFWRTTLFQSAIQNSKATIHTFIYMVEPDSWEVNKFFVWMVGDVLEPVPCDIIGLIEPTTIFSFGRGSTMSRQDGMQHDGTLKQFWYDYAVKRGLLKLEEIEELRKNKMVLIRGINSRIEAANNYSEE